MAVVPGLGQAFLQGVRPVVFPNRMPVADLQIDQILHLFPVHAYSLPAKSLPQIPRLAILLVDPLAGLVERLHGPRGACCDCVQGLPGERR